MTLHGIDISNNQPGPLRNYGDHDFAFCKATEGDYYVDTQLGRNLTGTPWVGHYAYVRPGKSSPQAQAQYFHDHAPLTTDAYALDIESGLGSGDGSPYPTPSMSSGDLDKWSADCATTLHNLTKRPVIIYCARNYGQILRTTLGLPFTRLWLATLDPNFPTTWNGFHVAFNQHSWTPIDKDLFNGSTVDLAQYRQPQGTAPQPAAKAAGIYVVRGTQRAPGNPGFNAAVQRRLGITADRSWGPQTTAALIAFQTAHGLVGDAIIGADTAHALGWAFTP